MKDQTNNVPVTNLPTGLAKPAVRALSAAGYMHLEQFTNLTEVEVLKLHGMGPKAIELIKKELTRKGLSFKE